MVLHLKHSATVDQSSARHGSITSSLESGMRKLTLPIHLDIVSSRQGFHTKDPTAITPDSGYASVTEPTFFKVDDSVDEYHEDADLRIFAFVVAIDKYASIHVPHLLGCKNDASDFINFLQDDLNVPKRRIMTLFDEHATRSAIINTFMSHFWDNQEIEKGDALVFFFSGHGTWAPTQDHWPAERGQIELLCPYDYDPDGKAYGIPDRTLDGLMRQLASLKGDNIMAILDCCHAGGMDRGFKSGMNRELGAIDRGLQDDMHRDLSGMGRVLPGGHERVRGIPWSSKPLPPTLDEHIWGPNSRSDLGASFEPVPGMAPYKAMASHVTLAACRSTERAKEKLCWYRPHRGAPPVQQFRGVFSVNLIAMLRTLGKRGFDRLTYSHLMDDLLRYKDQPGSLPPLDDQHPQCRGIHQNRTLFSMRVVLDALDSFILIKERDAWRVQAGTIHGITEGTQFHVPQSSSSEHTGGETWGTSESLFATNVGPTICEVRCHHPLPDSLNHTRVVVVDWHRADALTTYVHVQDAFIPGLVPRDARTGSLYRLTRDDHTYDLALGVIPHRHRGLRIDRFDPLVSHFCSSSHVLDVSPEANASEVLDAISRFNFHLYRFNTEEDVDKDLKLTVQLHLLERVLDGVAHEFLAQSHLSPRYEVLLHNVGKLLARHHYGDSVHRSGMSAMVHSNFSVPKPVMEAAITMNEERHFGLTLVNESNVDLYPYVFYFDPDTYAITRWYAPQHNTSDAPLLAKDRLHIGYGGSGADPMSFTRSMTHSQTNLGFLKVFVTTRYVELNIEQPPVLDSPGRDAWQPAIVNNPQAKAAHFGPVSMRDSWNAWIYVLTSKAKDAS